MKPQEINQFQLIKDIESLKTSLSSLESRFKSHIHDNFTSLKINNKNIVYDIIRPCFYKYELADEDYVVFPENNGVFLISLGKTENNIDNAGVIAVSGNGDVYLLADTNEFDNIDADGYLCIFNTGTEVRIKNRLGSKKIIKIVNFS